MIHIGVWKNVLEIRPDSEPDGLEWMLQCSCVSDQDLAETLVADRYDVVYRSALDHFGSEGQARRVADYILAQCIADRQQFWGEISLEEWLEKVRSQVFKLYDQRSRQALRLIPDIENNPANTPGWFKSVLLLASQIRRQHYNSCIKRFVLLIFLVVVFPLAVFLWQARPQADPAYFPKDRVLFYYQYTVKSGDSLESISDQSGLTKEVIKKLNPSLKGVDPLLPADLTLVVLKPDRWQKLLSSIKRVNIHPPARLTLSSKPEEVLSAIVDSGDRWQSLQANAWYVLYGTPGFLSQRQKSSIRLYAAQPDRMTLSLIGSGKYNTFSPNWHENLRCVMIRGNPKINCDFNIGSGANNRLVDMYFPANIDLSDLHRVSLKILGIERVAGREALVVDWYDLKGDRTHRLWVDSVYGAVLAWRQYAGRDFQSPFIDVIMETVQFDAVPQFESYTTNTRIEQKAPSTQSSEIPVLGWAPVPKRLARQGTSSSPMFDPVKSRLAIQWPESNQILPLAENPTPSHQIEIYGDGHYLGSLDFPKSEERFVSCTRSPDGRLVALTSRTLQNTVLTQHLSWFSVEQVTQTHTSIVWSAKYNDLLPYNEFPDEMAFSPDSRSLAIVYRVYPYSSPNDYYPMSRVDILDLKSQKWSKFLDLPKNVSQLTWNPDGKELAFIFPVDEEKQLFELQVYQVKNSALIYAGRFDPGTRQEPPGAPVQDWGMDFANPSGAAGPYHLMEQGCAAP